MVRRIACLLMLLTVCVPAAAERVIIGPFTAVGESDPSLVAVAAAVRWSVGVQLSSIPGVQAFDESAFADAYRMLKVADPWQLSAPNRLLLSKHTGCRYLLTAGMARTGQDVAMKVRLVDLTGRSNPVTLAAELRPGRLLADSGDLAVRIAETIGVKLDRDRKLRVERLLTGSDACVTSIGRVLRTKTASDRLGLVRPDGDSTAAGFLLAGELSASGKRLEAIGAYRRVLKSRPEWPTPHYDLGNAYFDERRYDEAVTEYVRTLKLDPDFGPAHENLIRTLRARHSRAEEVLREYQRLTAGLDGTGLVSLNLGRLVHELGRYDEARRQLEKAKAARPDDAVVAYNLARVLERLEKTEEAKTEYLRALELAPNYAKAHNNLGFLYERQGKLNVALFHYRRAVEFDPNYALAFNNLGVAYERKGNLTLAISAYIRVIELTPKDAVAHFNLAVAYHRGRQYARAAGAYRTTLDMDPKDRMAHFNLAVVYERLEQPDEAIRHWETVLKLSPTKEQAATARKHIKALRAQ